jgi:transcriptional regulator with XRE-family HTH domain
MNWNTKIVENRGDNWKKKLSKGRLDSEMNPTQLKILRVAKGLSQEEAAKKFRLSNSTYGGIERGLRLLSKSRAELIAKNFSKPVKALFDLKTDSKYIAIK